MYIDINYLNRFNSIDIDDTIKLDESYYKNTDIIRLSNLKVKGRVYIDYEDEVILDLVVNGQMILPCALTLTEVEYDFVSNIDESIGKIDEIYKNNKNRLEISEILWNNIVLEIPIRVVAKDIKPSNTSGDGWELI